MTHMTARVTEREQKGISSWAFVAIGIVAAGSIWSVPAFKEYGREGNAFALMPGKVLEISTNEWQTYRDKKFQFSIKYPADWRGDVTTSTTTLPVITFHKASAPEALAAPFNTSQNVTHVSVYPLGISADKIYGERFQAHVYAKPEALTADDLMLQNGDPFASEFVFVSPPKTWRKSGFLWAKVKIDNPDMDCIRKNEHIPRRECKPKEGDTVVRYGSIDIGDRRIIDEVIKTFEFY